MNKFSISIEENCNIFGISNIEICKELLKAIHEKNFDISKTFIENDKLGKFDLSKLNNLNPSYVINLLYAFKFQIYKIYDKIYDTMLYKFESYNSWLKKRTKSEINNLERTTNNLKKFLKAFIFFINSNPLLLNPNYNNIEPVEQDLELKIPETYKDRSIPLYRSTPVKNDQNYNWNQLFTNLPNINTIRNKINQ